MMITIGVSGGVASGKNFVSECFLKFGAKIFDADAEVAKLFSDNLEFQKVIKEKFPDSILNDEINKDLIAKKIFSDEFSLNLLESIIHPIINKKIDQLLPENVMTLPAEDTLKIIRYSNIHLSSFSACLFEAPTLGVPNIFWNYKNFSVEYFKEYIESKNFNFLVNDENELVRLLKGNIEFSKQDIIEQNKAYYMDNYEENIRNFISKLKDDNEL